MEALRELVSAEGAVAVLPTSEDVVRVLAEHEADLGAVIVGPTREQYRRLCDKGELADRGRRGGRRSPRTPSWSGPSGPRARCRPCPAW